MNDILMAVAIGLIALLVSTITYIILPFRILGNKKPRFTIFPKYVAKFDKSLSDIESALEKIGFKKINASTYTRGKFYGGFSGFKSLKLTVEIDEDNRQIKVYYSFIGFFYDSGHIWQFTSDLVSRDWVDNLASFNSTTLSNLNMEAI